MQADRKIMDYLARRAHSVKELREKLSRTYPPDEVERAIEIARKNNWLEDENVLAARVTAELGRKGKGRRYIERYLYKKGLPTPPKNSDIERQKALALVERRFQLQPPFRFEDKGRIFRMLQNRGFEYDIIQALFHDPI